MIQHVKQIVQSSNNIVFFGGAGTSTESGIPDFRSAEGLFYTSAGSGYRPEEVLSHRFFIKHPEQFYRFYLSKMIYRDAKPNAAHEALAKLEQMGKLKAVITQNIDGLHQLAGSSNVLELHGSVHRNFCMSCNAFFDLDHVLKTKAGEVPKCTHCGGTIKPDVVLYQENLDFNVLQRAEQAITEADVLIVGGTSLQVYPAAGLFQYYRGDKLILINKSATQVDHLANYVISDSIGKVMSSLVDYDEKNES